MWAVPQKHAAKWTSMRLNLPKNGNYFACQGEKFNSLQTKKTWLPLPSLLPLVRAGMGERG
jgi:hypothetical protein